MKRLHIAVLLLIVPACSLTQEEVNTSNAVAPGRPIAYVSQGLDFRDDVFLLSADGTTDSNLTRTGGYDGGPSWAPDGLKIVYESERSKAGQTDLFVLTLDGSVATARLTFDTLAQDAQPAWSPLGNRIAFASDRDTAGLEIYLMDLDGGGVKRVTTDVKSSAQPAWSADGAHIAFATDRTGNGEIFVMDTLGGNLVNLTNNSAEDLTPSWSPDGQRIAFMSDRGGGGFAIWVTNADGSNPAKISASVPPCEKPQWEPGGQRIAFDCDGDIFVVNADGTGRTQITRTSNTVRSEITPRWKP